MKTKNYIKQFKKILLEYLHSREKAILEFWGEFIGNEFTEQDIWEQTRKVMNNA